MKRFYNGKKINLENLVEMITENLKNNWKNSDLFKETEVACEIITCDYEGRYEDVECIIEKINNGATLLDIEKVIATGDWYFMETETWLKRR
ncbi:MAG: hypothetical protein QXY78_05380 [Thermoplasmata archaeon]